MALRVTFVDSGGVARTIDGIAGASIMETAIDHEIPEISTDCGGVCTCAACHVAVDPAWIDRFEPAGKIETSLLGLVQNRTPTSRLSCQLKLTPERDGVVVHTLNPDA